VSLEPTTDDVEQLARWAGLEFAPGELGLARDTAAWLLPALDVVARYESQVDRPPVYPGDRSRHWRPSGEEDPYRTFITRCAVEGAPDGPMRGVRIGVKDAIAVAGIPLTQGVRGLEGCIPDFDATVVQRALAAGATIVGKTNMEPFSSGVAAAGSRDFGVVGNPWDQARSPGGSSSGSGAAVAARTADVTFGTDSGGSVRIPAAWCGVVGLKATHAAFPMTGVSGFEPAHDHVGPLARDVPTLARVCDAVAGPDGYDLLQTGPAVEFSSLLERGVEGLRIGLLDEGFAGAAPDVAEAVEAAVAVLASAGATAERVSVPFHADALVVSLPLLTEGAGLRYLTAFAGLPVFGYVSPTLAAALTQYHRAAGLSYPLVLKAEALAGLYLYRRFFGAVGARVAALRPYAISVYDEALAQFDVLAMPTSPLKPPIAERGATYGEDHLLAGSGGTTDVALVARNTWPFNFTGHPAITVPCAVSDGLPVGLQLVTRRRADAVLLQTANAFQQSVDWGRLTTPPGVS
jgi:amidase